ncbi:MAG: 5-oxoprolinase/urea amidolyase family protein [Vicinamibacterales bacterium]
MSIDGMEVIEPGAFTTVQDGGRYGFQRYGVPVSGAMDMVSLRSGNLLVGNDERAAGLEMTLSGPCLRFLADTVVAITGADLGARLDDGFVPTWCAVPVARGMTLSFRGARAGLRAYLAVAGGIDVPEVLGSRSTYVRARLGGFEGRILQPGDRLPFVGERTSIEARACIRRPTRVEGHSATLRVIVGPHESCFRAGSLETFLSSTYVVSAQSDRMGYRLDGARLEHVATADIISEGTPAGAVQVSGDGLPILLLADRGTAGGYTKIATVVTADLPRAAQLSAGDRVRFAAVTAAEAVSLLRRREEFVRGFAALRRVVYQRQLFTTVVEGQEITAVSPFELARASQDDAETAAIPPRRTGRAWVGGRLIEVATRPLDSLPQPMQALQESPGRSALEAVAAVAWASTTGAAEPGCDLPLVLERPPVGPGLEALPVNVMTPGGRIPAEVRLAPARRGIVSAFGVTMEVAPEGAPRRESRVDRPAPREHRAAQVTARSAGCRQVTVRATLPGLVASVWVRPGENVSKGTLLAAIEAMKMENPIAAPASGRVSEVLVAPGTLVRAGDALFEIDQA